MSLTTSHRVAVVGAGWAGMAAAVELAAGGVPVTVFESARVLGGRARRVDANGVALDNGLHILIGAYRETLRLIAQVTGVPDAGLSRVPLDLHVLGQFRLRTLVLPAPLHLAAGLLGAQGLTLGERLSAARFMARLRATGFRLNRDVTVAELLSHFRQTGAAAHHLWESLCTSALNTPPQRASAQVFLNVLRDTLDGAREDSDLLLPVVNFSAMFPEPAAAYVERRGGEVRTGAAVSSVVADGAQLAVRTATEIQTFDHVVCALPPYRVTEVLGNMPDLAPVLRIVDRLGYEPIYSVFLQYPGTLQLPQAMFGLDGGLAQWIFDRDALCGQQGLIGVVISASGKHQELNQQTLASTVHRELRVHFPTLPEPLWSQVIAEKRATFSCVAGVERPANRTPVRNLYLAGDYTASDYPATLESAVRSGVACAQMILEDLSPQRHRGTEENPGG